MSLDPELVEKAENAVAAGAAPNVSAWVAAAMHDKAADDARDRAWDELIEMLEAEHGPITEQDMLEAEQHYAARSFVVDGRKGPRRKTKSG